MKQLLMYFTVMALLVKTGRAEDSQPPRRIDPQAERILRSACGYLAESAYFSITAEIWREHVDEDGQKVQFCRSMTMEVKRPNRLHAEIQSSHVQRGFWYDGQNLSVLDRNQNLFSTTSMPPTLDQAVDVAQDKFGIDLPMIDLAISDPFTNAIAKVISATYFGLSPAMGFNCHHIAFTQENIDWQVWIQDGPRPLIRKFVIVRKNEPGSPEFTALIREWNLTERIADSAFVFEAPRGAAQIQMQNESAPAAGPAAIKPTGAASGR